MKAATGGPNGRSSCESAEWRGEGSSSARKCAPSRSSMNSAIAVSYEIFAFLPALGPSNITRDDPPITRDYPPLPSNITSDDPPITRDYLACARAARGAGTPCSIDGDGTDHALPNGCVGDRMVITRRAGVRRRDWVTTPDRRGWAASMVHRHTILPLCVTPEPRPQP